VFVAYTLNVLIASPSDTKEQREAIRTTILKWNDSNSQYYQVTLLPVMWETHSFPSLGRVQGVINEQIVNDADILIGTFWTRLGTPTVVAESGTAEEIAQFEKSGRPVLLYFCEAPASFLTLDSVEIDRLKAYRKDMQSRALVSSYITTEELCERVREDLTRKIRSMKDKGEIPPLPEPVASSDDSNTTEGVVEAEGDLDDLRRALIGYRTKWQGQFVSIDAMDPSIDRRHDLMRNVAAVLWETVQQAAERCPGATVLNSLSALATAADELSNHRVYLDGGASFNALNDGCRKVIAGVQVIIDESWECNSPTN
jgi:hypothetical protein